MLPHSAPSTKRIAARTENAYFCDDGSIYEFSKTVLPTFKTGDIVEVEEGTGGTKMRIQHGSDWVPVMQIRASGEGRHDVVPTRPQGLDVQAMG